MRWNARNWFLLCFAFTLNLIFCRNQSITDHRFDESIFIIVCTRMHEMNILVTCALQYTHIITNECTDVLCARVTYTKRLMNLLRGISTIRLLRAQRSSTEARERVQKKNKSKSASYSYSIRKEKNIYHNFTVIDAAGNQNACALCNVH